MYQVTCFDSFGNPYSYLTPRNREDARRSASFIRSTVMSKGEILPGLGFCPSNVRAVLIEDSLA